MVKNLNGLRFGHLLVSDFKEKRGKQNYWKCYCDCGEDCFVRANHLLSESTKSCGKRCIHYPKNRRTHNLTKTRQYGIWSGLKNRCLNKNNTSYKNYGGRGISVSPDWLTSFEVFWRDMRNGYDDSLEIDRIDNNGNYCKENCRWVTRKQNNQNRRNSLSNKVALI